MIQNSARFFILVLFVIVSASFNEVKSQWKNNPWQLLDLDEIQREIEIKNQRIRKFLTGENLSGIVLTQVRNFSWITAGSANNQIVLNSENGAASLLIMNDGKKYLICSGSESGRLMDESLEDLDYTLKMFDWYRSTPNDDVRAHLPKEVIEANHPEVRIHYDGKRVIDDPSSLWFEFTGKGAGRAKCGSARAESKCKEFCERYAEMKQRAETMVAGCG